MDFVAKRRTMVVTIEDEKFNVTFPTMGMGVEHDAAVAKNPEKSGELVLDFIEKCGLPREQQMMMETVSVLELFEVLVGKKKL